VAPRDDRQLGFAVIPAAVDREEIVDFLSREAELLDDGLLEDWLELFAADGMFWIPLDPDADPQHEPSILYDDAERRAARVHQIVHETHWSQRPPSRTVHAITNVRIVEAAADETLVVRCNLVVTELRSGGHRALQYGLGEERSFAGRCTYRLRREDGTWKIVLKKVVLLQRDQAIENLTFIL
jgi:3-phenylpropionate/cinnamic acid dioxygenase small subunit